VRICLVATEIFAWGKYGGFGRAARVIGRELVRRGHEVSAVVPRRAGQGAVEVLDGITVHGVPPRDVFGAAAIYRRTGAELFHSCEVSYGTVLAQRAAPGARHMITFRDPRDRRDWLLELARPSASRLQVAANWLYEGSPLVRGAVRRADARYVAAPMLAPKVRAMYGLAAEPEFLPTPIPVPALVRKAATPTVCFLGRFDRRKRPELFFELARRFPQVHFVAAGASRDAAWDRQLRDTYGGLPNLELPGVIDQFASDRLSELLARSWILVNTASREGLPNSFLEAAAHRCAILSHVDPDGFASTFGYHAARDDFGAGLERLLDGDAWRERGERAWRHVREHFDLERAVARHEAAYASLLAA
jgi:glycosyltransferase involved in cell wall biosynthesis